MATPLSPFNHSPSSISNLITPLHSLEDSAHVFHSQSPPKHHHPDDVSWAASHSLHFTQHCLDMSSPPTPLSAYSSTLQNRPVPSVFQMPLHYPRYKKTDYETMPEWKLDRLLEEYGLPIMGSLSEKREYAIGAFLWKDQRG